MTNLWKILETLIFEAKTSWEHREDIIRYTTRRYGQHLADEIMSSMGSMDPEDFIAEIDDTYGDSKLNALVGELVASLPKSGKEKTGPSTRMPTGQDKGSGPHEPIPDRPDRVGMQSRGMPNTQVTLKPGEKPSQGISPVSAYKVNPQPSQTGFTDKLGKHHEPISPSSDPSKPSKSALVIYQREVDKETHQFGKKAGEALAKELNVPTSAQRTKKDHNGVPIPGEKPVVWPPEKALKFMHDPDAPEFGGAEKSALSKSRLATLASRAANAEPTAKKIPGQEHLPPQGTYYKTPTSGKTGTPSPEMSRDFKTMANKTWKAAGVGRDVMSPRPDKNTSKMVYGKRHTNPEHEGPKMVQGKNGEWTASHGSSWEEKPSVKAAKAGLAGAAKFTKAQIKQHPEIRDIMQKRKELPRNMAALEPLAQQRRQQSADVQADIAARKQIAQAKGFGSEEEHEKRLAMTRALADFKARRRIKAAEDAAKKKEAGEGGEEKGDTEDWKAGGTRSIKKSDKPKPKEPPKKEPEDDDEDDSGLEGGRKIPNEDKD